MDPVSTSIEIERPSQDVFAFVSDVSNNPRWQSGQRSCAWTSAPPVRVGSTYDQRARFLGRDLVNHFAVTEIDPGRRIRWQSTGGTFPLTITRTVEPLGERRSRFTELVEGGPTGPARLADPLTRRLVARSIRRDFPRLKALLEA
jgi:uncharacterized membrane protein